VLRLRRHAEDWSPLVSWAIGPRNLSSGWVSKTLRHNPAYAGEAGGEGDRTILVRRRPCGAMGIIVARHPRRCDGSVLPQIVRSGSQGQPARWLVANPL
jgi:hypothetical protein